jgi:hypothetical protein
MTYRLLTEIKVRTSQGETVLPPGKIIRLDPAKAHPLIESGKIIPIEYETRQLIEDRQEYLLDRMSAIILQSRDNIVAACRGRQFQSNEEARKAEHNIESVQHKVMAGAATLGDFEDACRAWENKVKEGLA